MVIANEKIERLSCYLAEDQERAEKMLQMAPGEILCQLNEETGLAFTVGELSEIGDLIRKSVEMQESEELSEEVLEAVTGGASDFDWKQLVCGPFISAVIPSPDKCIW